jgi:hypothetical protein
MPYRLMGRAHAGLRSALVRRPAGERGQGTVEYVALILLVSAVLAGVVVATRHSKIGAGGIATTIVNHIKSAISSVK